MQAPHGLESGAAHGQINCKVAPSPVRGGGATKVAWSRAVQDQMAYFDNPLLLGFEHTRALLERASRGAAEGYPPYNIEDCGEGRIRITLAVAGFSLDQLSVQIGDNQLTIVGRREAEHGGVERDFIHRGIAARGFLRVFVLADGVDVIAARLGNGLLHIEAQKPASKTQVRQVPIERVG